MYTGVYGCMWPYSSVVSCNLPDNTPLEIWPQEKYTSNSFVTPPPLVNHCARHGVKHIKIENSNSIKMVGEVYMIPIIDFLIYLILCQ